MQEGTGTDAGLNGAQQIEIALKCISDKGGCASIQDIYQALESVMSEKKFKLSFQGKSSIRFFVNKVAVVKGLIKKYDPKNPGWRATTLGLSLVNHKLSTRNEVTLPTEELSKELTEGNFLSILVNKYERNPIARKQCLEHHGVDCKVCGVNFSEEYGSIGKDFIHIHHVIPLASIKSRYVVDPINDLVPVCPNCHSMLHMTDPPMSLEKLKAMRLLADLI